MATPVGIPTLSGFRYVISAGYNIILSLAVAIALLVLRPKALSFKVKFFKFFALSDPASAPSSQIFSRILPGYSSLGTMSSAAEGQ